jgi:hypothetical protein
MKSLRTASIFSRPAGFLAVAALAFTTACADGLTAPTQAPDATRSNGLLSTTVSTLLSTLIPVKALTRTTAVTTNITRSVKFTKSVGGTIAIPELGLSVTVPAGALPRDTMTITVTAEKGRMIAYDFQPHGTKFLKPLVFRQDLAGTSWGTTLLGSLNGGYFKSTTQLDPLKNTALLDELLPAVILLNRQVTFNINHFSGYMVSSGRQSSYSTDEAF